MKAVVIIIFVLKFRIQNYGEAYKDKIKSSGRGVRI